MRHLFLIVVGLGIISAPCYSSGQERNIQIGIKQDTASISALLNHAKTTSNNDSGIILSKEALNISYQLHSDNGIARSLLTLGACIFNKGDYKESKIIFYKAIPYCRKVFSENSIEIANLYNDLANVCTKQGKTDSAIRYYFKSLEIVKKNKVVDSSLLDLLYANIGATLTYNNQGDQALYYLKIGMQYAVNLKDTLTYIQSLMNFGSAYATKGAEDSAVSYWKRVIKLSKLVNAKSAMSKAYYYIGNSMGRQGHINMAKIYFDSAIHVDINEAIQNVNLQSGVADIYLTSGNYQKAIPYYKRVIAALNSIGVVNSEPSTYYNLAECYSKVGNKDSAYKYLKIYSDARDSLINTQQIESINQIEIKYRTSEKDNEIAKKQFIIFAQESKLKEKNLWIGVITGSSLILAALGFTLFRGYKRKQEIALLYTQQQQQQGQLKVLMLGEENERKRIARELHDGIGSLISAAKLHLRNTNNGAAQENYENGLNLLDDAYNELRLTAHNLVPEQLLSEGLVNAVKTYCNKISKPPLFNVSFLNFGTEKNLLPEKELSLYRIIQELVHNAHKHGHATEVTVQISYYDSYLYISVEDNGVGLSAEGNGKIAKSDGIGLQNLKERIALFGATIEMDDRPGMGMTVYIEINIA